MKSGNLLRAVQRGENEYDLFLRADLHTTGYMQWFYFAVTNTHPPALVELYESKKARAISRVTFNIVNLTKPDSLFNQGMKPILYSYYDADMLGIGWSRTASDIQYKSNQYPRQLGETEGQVGVTALGGTAGQGANGMGTYYTLSFTIDFHNPKDVYLIAHTYPYTYSDHKSHIARLLHPAAPTRRHMRHSVLCQSLGGNDCDLITITDFSEGEEGERT